MSIAFTGLGFRESLDFNISLYSDNTPLVKTEHWGDIIENADRMILKADSMNEFITGMFLEDAIHSAGGRIKTLVIPYLPGARQDRSNPTGDVLTTARSVASMINRRHFDRVIAVDPHSPVMPSLIDNFDEFPLRRVYGRLSNGWDGVIAPDEGAITRAAIAAGVLGSRRTGATGIGYSWAKKHRDVSTGRIISFEPPELEEGKHYLVVDDICDGGGTFWALGEKIKEAGAKADLFVTHGIFSKGTRELRKYYKTIYTTDTRGQFANGLMIINIMEEMENY